MAASAMTETVMPPDLLANMKVERHYSGDIHSLLTHIAGLQPEWVAPFVLAVTHPDGPNASGRLFELGAGFVAEVRWERSKGTVFKTDASFTPSAVSRRVQLPLRWLCSRVFPFPCAR